MTQQSAPHRYRVDELLDRTAELFSKAGCDGDKPEIIAKGLVEADLLGHTTHGLQLAEPYLKELEAGTMTATGEPTLLSDRGAVATWDGRRLPGIWLTFRAVAQAVERAEQFGLGAVTIRNSHHIGCLAVFLEDAARRGFLIQIASSDPAVASVAPYGGRTPVMTPDPIAIGIPTDGDPILIDISASISTNGMANRLRREGRRFPGPWAQSAEGHATDDPEVLFTDPPGTLLPTGGVDHGHKGYALALWIEAITQGLSGFGRADRPAAWGASVYVQATDPRAFGGLPDFVRQTGWLAETCRSAAPRAGVERVRVPGQLGLERKRSALRDGLELYPGIELRGLAPF